jgi:hypothetical protein
VRIKIRVYIYLALIFIQNKYVPYTNNSRPPEDQERPPPVGRPRWTRRGGLVIVYCKVLHNTAVRLHLLRYATVLGCTINGTLVFMLRGPWFDLNQYGNETPEDWRGDNSRNMYKPVISRAMNNVQRNIFIIKQNFSQVFEQLLFHSCCW